MDHRTCAQTHCALSMREVDNALNALHALDDRGQGHFRSYFLGDELLALLCTLEMYLPHIWTDKDSKKKNDAAPSNRPGVWVDVPALANPFFTRTVFKDRTLLLPLKSWLMRYDCRTSSCGRCQLKTF